MNSGSILGTTGPSPTVVVGPDSAAVGLTSTPVDARRYDGHTDDPLEVAGRLSALVPPKARLLDVGCGTGSVTQIVARRAGAQVVGIEPDVARAEIARGRGVEVITGFLTAERIDELGQTFDVVMFADVLEHLAEPAEMLRLASRALVPGGVVVASVPNVAHWSVRWNLLRGRFDYEDVGIMDATHLRWFTERNLRGLFEASGFEVERVVQTVGADLPAYTRRSPWRYLSSSTRRAALMRLLPHSPTLFGCQHVIRARLRRGQEK